MQNQKYLQTDREEDIEKVKEKTGENKLNLIVSGMASFMIPACLFLLICFYKRIAPFGDRTFLYEDMKQQYVDFFSYLSNAIRGHDNFLYSYDCGLGSDMNGFITYYLTSPLNLLFCIVPKIYYPIAVTFLIMIKLSLIGLFTWIFLVSSKSVRGTDLKPDIRNITAIFFSTAFAYSGFVVANMTNIMWLEPIMMLPLITLFYERMLRGERKGAIGYVASVAVSIVLGYYLTAMILIFLGILSIILMISKILNVRGFIRFIKMSLLSVVLDLWFLYPTVRALMGSNKDHSGSDEVLGQYLPVSAAVGRNLNPISIIPKLLGLSFDSTQIMEGLPNIYFGTLLLLPLFIFFFNKKIDIRRRLSGLAFIAIITAFFCIKTLNLIAHGGTEPYGYLYRYSFIFSFVAICLAYECINHYKGIDVAAFAKGLVILAALYISVIMLDPAYLDDKKLVIDLMITGIGMIVCGAVLFADRENEVSKNHNSRIQKAVLVMGICCGVLVHTLDLGVNFINIYNTSSYNALGVSEYVHAEEETENLLEQIEDIEITNGAKSDDSENYRIESIVKRTPNDSLHFGYKGIQRITAYCR